MEDSDNMTKPNRLIIASLVAATALAAAVGSANARRLALSENHILSHFREMTFEGGIGAPVVCAMSLEGSFHSRTLEKVVRSLVGYVTEVRIQRPCRGGEAWVLTAQEGRAESLPWHLLYERFIGALPNITGIELTLDNGAFLISIPGVCQCLYRATTTSPMRGIVNREAGGKLTGDRVNEATRIPLSATLSGLCPSSSILSGVAIIGAQVGYREVTVTLVAYHPQTRGRAPRGPWRIPTT
jgi:hypothetical protein